MIEKIHEIKMKELNDLNLIPSEEYASVPEEQPYTMCGVAHSLGGAGLLMYVVTRLIEHKPHRLSRLILLSPAGFHKEAPWLFDFYQIVFPALAPIAAYVMPGLYIKTRIFRGLFNKLARDFQNYPAVGGLVQTLCSYFIAGGDSSNWVEALGLTHYNVYDMPGVAYRVIVHLAQLKIADRFQMFDYGSVDANMKAYGTPYPLDIGEHYRLIDIPVDFVAGRKDKLIPRSNIRRHYQVLRDSGGAASYSEFDYAHLDFTVAHKEDLVAYVMSKLLLVTNPSISSAPSTSRATIAKSGRTKGEMKKDWKRLKSSRHEKSSDLANGIDTLGAATSSDSGEVNPEEDTDAIVQT
ncbi:hypothetical protein L7F22_047035 [Adiantum nelumboides]|nr:hypothetical protein [Adiantum nelumboides]